MTHCFKPLTLAAICVAATITIQLPSAAAAADPWQLCASAIDAQERIAGTPSRLLTAISLAESGRSHPKYRKLTAWPWTVNAEGKGRFFATRGEAIDWIASLRARNVRSIDVGCMQVNLLYHPDAFTDIDEALDPSVNVAYAARYLRSLYADSGSWERAAGLYHSATPEFHDPYRKRVVALWNDQVRGGGDSKPPEFLRVAAPASELVAVGPLPNVTSGTSAPAEGRARTVKTAFVQTAPGIRDYKVRDGGSVTVRYYGGTLARDSQAREPGAGKTIRVALR